VIICTCPRAASTFPVIKWHGSPLIAPSLNLAILCSESRKLVLWRYTKVNPTHILFCCSMDSKTTFTNYLREHFAPLLRSTGFNGSGSNFRRISNDVIQCVNIQGNKYGGSCAVNLGLHLTFLPIAHTGKCPNIKTVKEVDCDFRKRLTPDDAGDYWWDYKGSILDPTKNAKHLIRTYEENGATCFAKCISTDQVAAMITVDDLRSNTVIHTFGTMTVPRASLTMARIHAHIGNGALAREYANIGLENIGRATALKEKLQAVINATEQSREPERRSHAD